MSIQGLGLIETNRILGNYSQITNNIDYVDNNIIQQDILGSYANYTFKNNILLPVDSSSNSQHLLNYNGSYTSEDNRNSLLLTSNSYAIIPATNWRETSNLCISGWFKTSDLANNDEIFRFGKSFFYDTTNIVAWYRFDDNATNMLLDSSGNNYTLTNNSATFDSTNYKTNGGSVYLNGSSQYLDINANINPYNIVNSGNGGITFSVWFKIPSNTANYSRIFSFGDGTIGSISVNTIAILKNNTAGSLYIVSKIQSIESGWITTTTYLDNTWHHLVLSISTAGLWSVYIDNIYYSTTITTKPIPSATWTKRYIGRSEQDAGIYTTGNFDDFRIYNRILTADEVAQLYWTPFTMFYNNLNNLICWYKFEQNNILLDSSRNNNNLTNYGTVFNNTDYKTGAGCISFNGSSRLEVANTGGRFSPDIFTISCWCKIVPTTTANAYSTIAMCRDTGGGTASKGWNIYTYNNNLEFWTGLNTNLWSGAGVNLFSKFASNPSRWLHLAITMTKSTNTALLYINGNLISTLTRTYVNNTTINLCIGAGYTANYLQNGSLIDDFRMYNRVLTADEIFSLYTYSSSLYSLNTDLVAWYKFDGNATDMLLDSSGNRYTLVNNSSVAYDTTNFKTGGGSALFNGTLKWFDMPSTINPYTIANVNGITMVFWIKCNTNSVLRPRFFEFSDNAINTAPSNSFMVHRNDSNNSFVFIIATANYTTTTAYVDNNWHHVVWSITQTGVWTIYIDGMNLNISVTRAIPNVTWQKRYIGRGWVNNNDFLNGNIDDFRIYSRVLTADEVTAIYSLKASSYIETPYNMSLIKRNEYLSFQVNDLPVYETSNIVNNTWNHFVWNVLDTSTTQGFIRINNSSKVSFRELDLAEPILSEFPPEPMKNYTTLINGITYRACAANHYNETTYRAWEAFSKNKNDRFITEYKYNDTTGVLLYDGVTFGNDTSFKGYYLGIDMGQQIVLRSYEILQYPTGIILERLPKTWKIYATNDTNCWNNTGGSERTPCYNTGADFGWVEIDYRANQTTYTDDTAFTISNNYKGYRFYALHVNSVRGGVANAGLIQIAEWVIYGYPYYTYNNRIGSLTNKGRLYLNDLRLYTNVTTPELENNFYDKYTLLNSSGTLLFAFSSNENKIISLSKKELELNSINYGSSANLSISTWFKTTNFANNDTILEISNDFVNDTTNLYFWYKFNSHQFLKNFGIAGSTYDLILSSSANTVSCQTSDKVSGDASANFTASAGFLYTPVYNFATNFTTACSISFWLKRKGLNTNADTILYGIDSTFTANNLFGIEKEPDNTYWYINLFGNSSSTNGFLNDYTADNIWNHYVMIAEKSGTATKLTIYKNGSSTAVYTSTSGTWTPPNIGFMLSYNTSPNTLIGNLDDYRIYNKVLSTSEIAQLYNFQNTNNILIKRRNNTLSFQINSTPIYETLYIDNKWNHILWNINNNTSSQGFIRINNGIKQNFIKTSPTSANTYLSKLGSQLNSGDLYLYDFEIITNQLTSQMETDLYNNVAPPDYTEFTKINNIQIYSDKIKIKNTDYYNISNFYLDYDFKQNTLTINNSSNIRNLNIIGSGAYVKDFNKDCLLLKTGQEAFFANDNWMNYKDLTISGWFKSDRPQDGDDIILNMTAGTLPNNSFFSDITNLHFWYKFNTMDTLKNYGLAGKNYDLFNADGLSLDLSLYPKFAQKTDKVYGDASLYFVPFHLSIYINNNYDFSQNFTSACTISFWLKRKQIATNSDNIIHSFVNGVDNTFLSITRFSTFNYWLIRLFGYEFNTNTLLNDYTADNNWNHYVWIAEKQSDNRVKVSCYKNSIFIFSSTGGTWTTISAQFRFSNSNNQLYMLGNLDDFRIYNKILSQDEINVLFYNTGFNNHTANLVAWYQFNDSATNMLNDSSGNNYMLINNSSVAFDAENFRTGNGSAYFDATLRWFDMPSAINPYTIMINGGITIACWFRISFVSNSNARIFEFSDNAVNVAPTNVIQIRIDSTTKQLRFIINTTDHYTPNFYNDDLWHHVVWSITSAGAWTIYIDGDNINASRTQAIPNATWVKRYIGRSWYNLGDFLCGNIDDFRIYNRVLTASEAYSLYSVNYNMPNNYIIKRQNNTLSFQINNTAVYETSYTNDTWNHFIWNIANSSSHQGFVKLNNGSKNYFNEILPSIPNIFKYPPDQLLGATTGLSGFGINSGYYTASSSSTYSSTEVSWNAFNTSNFSMSFDNLWTSAGTYNGTTGAYTGAVSTTVSGTAYTGEWLQIQLPNPIVLLYYYIYTQFSSRLPKDFIIAGSNNGSTWTLVDNETNSQVWQNNSKYFRVFNNTQAFAYYRLIIQNTNNLAYVSVQEWELYGFPIYSYTNKLGSSGNQGSLYLSDFSIITTPINSAMETQLYTQASEYKNLCTNEYIQNQIRNINALYYNSSKKIEASQYGANVYGTLTATGNITSYFSDMRLKDVICNIDYPVDKINNISTFKYIPNELAKSVGITDTKINVGVSAQDVQEVLPEIIDLAPFDTSNLSTGEIVSRSGHNFLSVSYTDLVPLLIEGIKDLIKKLRDKKTRLDP